MHGELRISPGRACKIIVATAILHNVAINRNLPDFNMEDENNMQGVELIEYDERLGAQTGKTYRQHIADAHFS
uniref:Nuclease HARBI1 n=1 Tax=Romanomermis culicivorax TaxID=13658 RepID=A0A915KVX4_ROMCU